MKTPTCPKLFDRMTRPIDVSFEKKVEKRERTADLRVIRTLHEPNVDEKNWLKYRRMKERKKEKAK